MPEEIILRDGKYKFYMDGSGILRCLRNGSPWRDFVGDNAVLALFRHTMECRSVADGVLTALQYPRGSEAQIRCLEEVGQDARALVNKS